MTTLINTASNPLAGIVKRSGLLESDLDYHIVRASMVIMFFFFGYQKWWAYEVDRLEPFISNGPLIWLLYPVFGHQGASWFLGICEWTFGACCSRVSGTNGSASLALPVQPPRSLG